MRKSKAANETSIQNNTALSQSALLAEEEEGEEEEKAPPALVPMSLASFSLLASVILFGRRDDDN